MQSAIVLSAGIPQLHNRSRDDKCVLDSRFAEDDDWCSASPGIRRLRSSATNDASPTARARGGGRSQHKLIRHYAVMSLASGDHEFDDDASIQGLMICVYDRNLRPCAVPKVMGPPLASAQTHGAPSTATWTCLCGASETTKAIRSAKSAARKTGADSSGRKEGSPRDWPGLNASEQTLNRILSYSRRVSCRSRTSKTSLIISRSAPDCEGVSKSKLRPSVSGREAPQQRTDCEWTPRCKLRPPVDIY